MLTIKTPTSFQTTSSSFKSKPSQPTYQEALTPFTITSDGGFLNLDNNIDEHIKRDVVAALKDKDCPPATAIKIVEMVFDTSCQPALNAYIKKNGIVVRAINKQVIDGLGEKENGKGIKLTLEEDGTINMTAEAEIPGTYNGPLKAALEDEALLPVPDLGKIVAAYVGEPRLTLKCGTASGPKAIFSSQFKELCRLASNQDKVHVLSFLNHFYHGLTTQLTITNADLRDMNLSGLRLNFAAIVSANLTNTDFFGARFDMVQIVNTPISSTTNFMGIKITNSSFTNCRFEENAMLALAEIGKTTFKNSPIADGAVMSGAELRDITLKKSRIGQPRDTFSTPSFLNITADKDSRPLPKFPKLKKLADDL